MERITGIDATFLYAETPEQPMVVNGVIEIDVSTMDGGYSFDRLRVELARRIKEIPQFRRAIYDSALNFGHPAWVEEYDLDIRDHFKRLVLPTPSPPRAVEETLGVLASRPLDRTKPLWEAFALENPDDPDHVTVLARAHHSILDGINATKLIKLLAGTEAIHPAQNPELMRIEAGGKNPMQLIVGGAWDYVRRPLKLARLVPETLVLPFAMNKSRGETSEEDPSPEAMPLPFTAPRTRFNKTLTPHRALSTASLELAELKRIKNAFGCKLNDVLLTIVGGGLRSYLEYYDDLPEKPLVAVMPTSVHAQYESKSSNQLSVMFGALGTDIDDPVDRLRAIAPRSKRGKSQSKAMRPNLLEDWASLAPGMIINLGMNLYRQFHLADRHPVIYNLIVSNVPGPEKDVWFLGAKVTHMYPLGPLLHGAGVSVTALSLSGSLNLGIISCEHLVPDPHRLAEFIESELDALSDAVDAGNVTPLSFEPRESDATEEAEQTGEADDVSEGAAAG